MRRTCPDETILCDYMTGCLDNITRTSVEEHLLECKLCRNTLSDTHTILSKFDAGNALDKTVTFFRKKLWIMLSVTFIILSFFIKTYFFQCLMIGFLCGMKAILDAKSTGTFVMIQKTVSGEQKKEQFEEKTKKK